MKIVILLIIFIMVGCVLVAGCSIPTIKNTKAGNFSSPPITPSITAAIPAAVQTTVPSRIGTSIDIRNRQLIVSIGDYPAEKPVSVLIDNVSQTGNRTGI